MKVFVLALLLSFSAGLSAQVSIPVGVGWWVWCETDPYTGKVVCFCMRGTSDNGNGQKNGTKQGGKGK